jgi:hypothetical protein
MKLPRTLQNIGLTQEQKLAVSAAFHKALGRQRWQVEMLIGDEWCNVWHDAETGDSLTFDTRKAARAELNEHIDSLTVEQVNDHERFRIVKVQS